MPEDQKGSARRWIPWVGAGLAGLCVFGALVMLLPPVQRWCLVSFLESPGLDRVTVDHVRVRPGSFEIDGLVIEAAGMRMASGRMQGTGPLWKALFGGGLHLDEYRVEDWRLWLDLQVPEEGARGAIPMEAGLVFGPLALDLDRADLSGRIEVVISADRTLSLESRVRGRDFGRDRTGVLEVEGALLGLRPDGQPSPVEFRSELTGHPSDGAMEMSLSGSLGGVRTPCFLSAVTRYEKAMLTTEGVIHLDLPALEMEVLGEDEGYLSSGSAELKFRSTSNRSGETVAEGDFSARDLVAAGSGYRIDRISSPWRAVLNSGQSVLLRVPLEVERAAFVSDLLVAVSAVADEPSWQMEGSLTGDLIAIDDLAILVALFRVPADREVVDLNPAWRDLRGQVGLDFGRVWIRKGLVATNLKGTVTLTDEAIRLSDLTAGLAGGSVDGSLVLSHDASTAEPHHLEGSWVARDLESEQFLVAGKRGPVVEGPFGAEITVQAQAPNPRLLGERLTGEFALLGGPGIFRGLGGQVEQASNLAGMLSTLFQSDSLKVVADLSQLLSVVPYDQIRLDLRRMVGTGVEVGRIQLQGPDIKLAGLGWIGSEATVDFITAPMNFEFSLGAKGRLADLLEQVGLTSLGRIDAEGYRTMPRSFSIRGTPAQPDVSELWAILKQAAVETLFGR